MSSNTTARQILVFGWKTTALRAGRVGLTKGGHSCCIRDSRVSCWQVISLARCILIQISGIPTDMGEACSLCSNVVMECHYC
jgi:hypothetical protein